MLGQAAQLGCAANDIACLCKNANFGYGIRDCSIQSCGNVDQANALISWGNNLCASVNVPASISSVTSVAVSAHYLVSSLRRDLLMLRCRVLPPQPARPWWSRPLSAALRLL